MRVPLVPVAQALIAAPILVAAAPRVGAAGLVAVAPLLALALLGAAAIDRKDDVFVRLASRAAFVLTLSTTLPWVFGPAAPLAVLAWGLLLVPASRLGLAAAVAGAGVVAATGALVPVFGAWTLLEPAWDGVDATVPRLAAAALVLAGVTGLGSDEGPDPRRSARAAGLAWAAAIGAAAAVSWARQQGVPTGVLLVPFALAGLLPPAPALASRERVWVAALGAAFTAAFAGPARDVAEAALGAGLPLIGAGLAGREAARRAGTARWIAIAVGVSLIIGVGATFPGIPPDIGAAVTLALLPVALLWTAGTAWLRSAA